MRNGIISTAALVLGLGPMASLAQDASIWEGAYGALTYEMGKADQLYDDSSALDLEGDGPGLLVGYNHAIGAWIIGAELAYSAAEIAELPPNTNFTFKSFVDLKARAGYAVDKFLIYGTLGATFTQWNEGNGDGPTPGPVDGPYDGNGVVYGLGVDYLVSPKIFVGAEYLMRDVTSDWQPGGDDTFDADVSSITLRIGMKF